MTCTRCQGTGFLNLHQIDDPAVTDGGVEKIERWIKAQTEPHDVQVCDCCGDGEGWYGTPGEHYSHDDPRGPYGPYARNGGVCDCN